MAKLQEDCKVHVLHCSTSHVSTYIPGAWNKAVPRLFSDGGWIEAIYCVFAVMQGAPGSRGCNSLLVAAAVTHSW